MNSNFSYENIVKELNLTFHDLNNVIKNEVENYNDITTRKREISFIENLLCKFLYSVPKTTKTEITSSFNFENNT